MIDVNKIYFDMVEELSELTLEELQLTAGANYGVDPFNLTTEAIVNTCALMEVEAYTS